MYRELVAAAETSGMTPGQAARATIIAAAYWEKPADFYGPGVVAMLREVQECKGKKP